MGSRERKRQERRKRKRRAAARTGDETAPERAAAEPDGPAAEEEGFPERMARRSERRNVEARTALVPLAAGERPGAVTAATVVSGLLALIFTASAVVAAIGSVEISGEEPSPLPLAVFAAVLWLMTWGLWRTRYWGVLGFQMLLVLFMLSSALGLVQVSTVLQALGTVFLLLGSGLLFYFLIRAMARIQMPERPGDASR